MVRKGESTHRCTHTHACMCVLCPNFNVCVGNTGIVRLIIRCLRIPPRIVSDRKGSPTNHKTNFQIPILVLISFPLCTELTDISSVCYGSCLFYILQYIKADNFSKTEIN